MAYILFTGDFQKIPQEWVKEQVNHHKILLYVQVRHVYNLLEHVHWEESIYQMS